MTSLRGTIQIFGGMVDLAMSWNYDDMYLKLFEMDPLLDRETVIALLQHIDSNNLTRSTAFFNGEELLEFLNTTYNFSDRLKERTVNGTRTSPFYLLTPKDILQLKKDIRLIRADESIFYYNDDRVRGTGYIDELDIIILKGNVLPDLDSGSTHPRDIMSARAVLAHEYYGHRAHRWTDLPRGHWKDEYRASRDAAEFAPGLSKIDRVHLVLTTGFSYCEIREINSLNSHFS